MAECEMLLSAAYVAFSRVQSDRDCLIRDVVPHHLTPFVILPRTSWNSAGGHHRDRTLACNTVKLGLQSKTCARRHAVHGTCEFVVLRAVTCF